MSETMVQRIRDVLQAGLAPETMEIVDESAAHAGHAGARAGGHYRVTVVSAAFQGLAPLARHRLVYALLHAEMAGPIHALALETRAPGDPGRHQGAPR